MFRVQLKKLGLNEQFVESYFFARMKFIIGGVNRSA